MHEQNRLYCVTCEKLAEVRQSQKHEGHEVKKGVSNDELLHPTEFLTPLENTKKEAQFLFSKTAVQTMVSILKDMKFR